MKRQILLMLLIIPFLSGCSASITRTMDLWVGHHKSELILSWGPPTRVTSDGKGGEILIYEYERYFGQNPGQVYRDGSYTAPTPIRYTAYRMFYVDKAGYIYNRSWQGI